MIQPYITFLGEAKDAIALYEEVFKPTDKTVMYYKDIPGGNPMEHMGENVLHATLNIGGILLRISDTDPNMHEPHVFANSNKTALYVTFETEEEIKAAYEKLCDGGHTMMALSPQFFAKQYAWIADKYGVSWQLAYGTN